MQGRPFCYCERFCLLLRAGHGARIAAAACGDGIVYDNHAAVDGATAAESPSAHRLVRNGDTRATDSADHRDGIVPEIADEYLIASRTCCDGYGVGEVARCTRFGDIVSAKR